MVRSLFQNFVTVLVKLIMSMKYNLYLVTVLLHFLFMWLINLSRARYLILGLSVFCIFMQILCNIKNFPFFRNIQIIQCQYCLVYKLYLLYWIYMPLFHSKDFPIFFSQMEGIKCRWYYAFKQFVYSCH
jgi:hypothetical protein